MSSILRHVRRGRILDVYTLPDGVAEVMEGEVLDTSPMAGKALSEVDMGDGIVVGAILHDGEALAPDAKHVIKPGDRIILLAERNALKQVEQLFRVSMDYF